LQRDHVDDIVEQWGRERPDLDVSQMAVIGRTLRLSRFFEQAMAETFGRFGLNRGEFDVLVSIRRAGAGSQLTPTELAHGLLLSAGAMTNRLDRLETAGFVRRRPDPSDGRGVLVSLTKRGVAVVDAALTAHIANEERLLSPLTAIQRAQLANLMRKLLISLEYSHDNDVRQSKIDSIISP
jgi:DNA-binding MarR family transcriptional regulator